VNTIGSYTCACNEGYQGTSNNCKDINECDNYRICENGACTNLDGGYSCECNIGYTSSEGELMIYL
jgi:hypothetical protein